MPMMPVLLYNSPIEKYRTLVIGLKICLIRIRLTTKFEADFFVIKVFQYFKKK